MPRVVATVRYSSPVRVPMRPANVAVVIPIHSTQLNANEQAAFRQLNRVLGAHKRIVVAPRSLDLSGMLAEHPLEIERFDDRHFIDVVAYNGLMLDAAFYRRFEAYEYILIHQLDAYVFRDELAYWCNRSFDYIGAPWMTGWPLTHPAKALLKLPQGWFTRHLLDAGNPKWGKLAKANQVGNGGFSLRRIAAFLQVLNDPPVSIQQYQDCRHHLLQEDVFWGVAANRWRRRIRTPHWSEALHFSIEKRPGQALAFCGGRLPFGCHAWAKYEPDLWRSQMTICAER